MNKAIKTIKGQKKSCWNCKLSVGHRQEAIGQTFWQPGENAVIEECDCTGTWEEYEKTFSEAEAEYQAENVKHNWSVVFEEILADKCKYWIAEEYTCPMCKRTGRKVIESYGASHEYGVELVCTKKCLNMFEAKIRSQERERLREEKHYAKLNDKELRDLQDGMDEADNQARINSLAYAEDYYRDANKRILKRNNL